MYWLVKSEPSCYSIEDLKKDRSTHWGDVRNYQARNYLRDMKVGDTVLFYHSNEEPIGIAGLAKVKKTAYADPSQYDKKSEYFDPKATKENPRWLSPDLQFEQMFSQVITLSSLRTIKALNKMVLLQKGSRLSVQPVTEVEFNAIMNLTRSHVKKSASQ